ncbi:MAG TPA: transposase [Gammaproteobacteria bacterium]|nr:transposase [Gammaproteobacteria bacterium]
MAYNALRKGRVAEPFRAYLLTTITNRREPFFKDLVLARMVAQEMRRLHEEGRVASQTWVIMPDHLHWLVQLPGDLGPNREGYLGEVMKALKGRSARRVNWAAGRQGPLWQRAFHDHAVRDGEDLKPIARYVVANPVRSGLVDRVEDYPHWDSVWL